MNNPCMSCSTRCYIRKYESCRDNNWTHYRKEEGLEGNIMVKGQITKKKVFDFRDKYHFENGEYPTQQRIAIWCGITKSRVSQILKEVQC